MSASLLREKDIFFHPGFRPPIMALTQSVAKLTSSGPSSNGIASYIDRLLVS